MCNADIFLRFAKYPQELVLDFEELRHVKQIQILSHQSKICNKIEIHVGSGPPEKGWEMADFERLG